MFPVTVSCQGWNSDEICARCSHLLARTMLSHMGRKRPWAKEAVGQSDSKKSFRFVHVNFASHKIHNMFSVHLQACLLDLKVFQPIWWFLFGKPFGPVQIERFKVFQKQFRIAFFQISGVKSEVFPSFGGFCFGNFSTS